MATRIVAFLTALAMVAAALAVRAARDSDGSASEGGLALVCARELGDLCDELDARTEAANTTADRLIGLGRDEDPELDAWLVPGPWPQMVDDVREFDGKPRIFDEPETLGWSSLVVVTRGDAIDAACAESWNCLADGTIADGGHAVGAPAVADATGVLVRAAALSARVRTTEYGTEVFGDHGGWLTELTRALDRRQFQAGTLRRFLTTPGSADAFVTTRAAATAAGATDAARPAPPVEVALSLALRDGASKPAGINDLVLEHGWSPPQTPVAVDSGLPSPDVLYALREFL